MLADCLPSFEAVTIVLEKRIERAFANLTERSFFVATGRRISHHMSCHYHKLLIMPGLHAHVESLRER